MPSYRPTRKPTTAFSGVQVQAAVVVDGVQLNNVRSRQLLSDAMSAGRSLAAYGSMLLSAASDAVIAATLANELALSVDAVSLDSETLLAQTGGVSSVSVHFSVFAQASDFPGTTFTGDESAAVYAKIAGALNVSVTTGAFRNALVTEATAQYAPQLLALKNVTFTGVTYTSLNTAPADDEGKQNDLSGGEFAGLVIGVIVAFLALIALVVLCIRAQSDAHDSSTAATLPSKPAVKVAEKVGFEPVVSNQVQMSADSLEHVV